MEYYMEYFIIAFKYMILALLGAFTLITFFKFLHLICWCLDWTEYSHGDIVIDTTDYKKWYVLDVNNEKEIGSYNDTIVKKVHCVGLNECDQVCETKIPLDRVHRVKRASFKDYRTSKGQIFASITSEKFKEWAKENLK